MIIGPIREKIVERTSIDKEDGDIAFFYALMHQAEYLTKLAIAGIVSCLSSDTDRSRYSLEYRLVRANSLGDWSEILQTAVTGPPAQFFISDAAHIARELTERVAEGDWRYEALKEVVQVASGLGIEARLGQKAALRQIFDFITAIRNRTRGHGAITASECHMYGPILESALGRLWEGMQIFAFSWASLNRNLSGKYRVLPLLGECAEYDYLKRSRDEGIEDGVYIWVGGARKIPLLSCGSGMNDIYVPNGNYKKDGFEAISLITNEIITSDGAHWSTPPGRLPSSHTEGLGSLDQLGSCFTNLPEPARGHIQRFELEQHLREELCKSDRHPIVTLTGPGGIGKTTITLVVVDALVKAADCPYDVVMWMSSRDVDLLDSGPKPVRPKVTTKKAIAEAAVELLDPARQKEKGFDGQTFFEECLAEGAAGRTLFIFDNFETVDDPDGLFRWIDLHIRHPNKVLITTRFRDFRGDYPIEIRGMSDLEAEALINQESKRLGVSEIVDAAYTAKLINESDGHPYVIKILLGQVAKSRRAVSPERIIAGADHILLALFERTYTSLTPAAQRVFLLLSSWRSFVPAIAVEAVSLRPQNERFDVSAAIDELLRFSLIEDVEHQGDGQIFVGVPLAAASFGRRKLEASPYKVAVERDREILMGFGAGDRNSSRQGVMPRIDRLVKAAALRVNEDPSEFERILPILEYLGNRVPEAFLRIARLISELPGPQQTDRIKNYLRRYLETEETAERQTVWFWMADLCHQDNDALGEIHSLAEVAMLSSADLNTIASVANRLNNKLRDLKDRQIEEAWSSEVKELLDRVADRLHSRMKDLDGTACSRLAWLYLNIGNAEMALKVAKHGLNIEPGNEHCVRLVERLGI